MRPQKVSYTSGTPGMWQSGINNGLRLQFLFVITDWVCHVWCHFEAGYTCLTTVIFGTLKYDSLQMNSFASSYNCFSYKIVFQKGVNTLSKMVNHFGQKAQNFVKFGPYDFVQFYHRGVQILIKYCMERL